LTEKAHSLHSEDRFAIGEIALRAFDIITADVNGTWSDG
jgi:hypothetical protein